MNGCHEENTGVYIFTGKIKPMKLWFLWGKKSTCIYIYRKKLHSWNYGFHDEKNRGIYVYGKNETLKTTVSMREKNRAIYINGKKWDSQNYGVHEEQKTGVYIFTVKMKPLKLWFRGWYKGCGCYL